MRLNDFPLGTQNCSIALERGSFSLPDKISGFDSKSFLDPDGVVGLVVDLRVGEIFLSALLPLPAAPRNGITKPATKPTVVPTANLSALTSIGW
jgi:hypothetical protein